MQDPAPTAPDDEFVPDHPATSICYPARTTFRISWADAVWVVYARVVFWIFSIRELVVHSSNAPEKGIVYDSIVVSGATAVALFCVSFAQPGSGLTRKPYAFLTAMLGSYLSMILCSWLFQAVLSLCFLWYFLDQFILHGIDARATIPRNFAEQCEIRKALRDRWYLQTSTPIGIQHNTIPICIFFLGVLYIRFFTIDTASFPGIGGPLFLFLFLLITPFVIDFIAPAWGGRTVGPSEILSEFRKVCVSWVMYDRIKTKNPVVHHSPAGSPVSRTLIALSASVTILPLAVPRHFYRADIPASTVESPAKVASRDVTAEFSIDNARTIPLMSLNTQGRSGNNAVLCALPQTQRTQQTRESRLEQLQRETSQRQSQLEEMDPNITGGLLTEKDKSELSKHLRHLPEWIRFFLGSALTIAMPGAFMFFSTARLFAGYTARGFPLPAEKSFSQEHWSSIIDVMRSSDQGQLRRHIFWGVNTADNGPVIVPDKVLREHVHFLGDSGSGKTSLGISPLLAQLMQFGDASVIVIDLKADDQTLFEVMRDGARKNSQQSEQSSVDSAEWAYPFRYFSAVQGRASHGFNPFEQRAFRQLSALQKTDLLTTALGLQYGTDYGRKYFGDSNFSLLQAATRKSDNVPSFDGLRHLLSDKKSLGLPKKTIEDATNVMTSVDRLAAIEPLNRSLDSGASSNHPGSMIDLADLFEKPQAVFFALPAGTGSLMSAELARLVLFSLVNAAQHAQKPRRQVYVVMDEFQRAVSGNIEVLLQMARSHDISLILANQCLDDLRTPGADIASTVTNNTRIRQIFGVSTPGDLRDLVFASGERLILVESQSLSETPGLLRTLRTVATSLMPTPSPKLRVNDLIEASDHPNRSIFSLKRGEGLAQFQGYPFIMESCYHITPEEYDRRRHLSWPNATRSTTWLRNTSTDPDASKPASVPDPESGLVCDGDRSVRAKQNRESTEQAKNADPKALSDILRTLDDPKN